MKAIVFKGIRHNILNDAPFIGAVLIANSCRRACKGCINEALKSDAFQISMTPRAIMDEVMQNGLNEGVIFSGLEWSEQAEDLMALVHEALLRGLKVMVYTHLDEKTFFTKMPDLRHYPIYVKFGPYLPERSVDHYFSHGIKLATDNQYVKEFKGIH